MIWIQYFCCNNNTNLFQCIACLCISSIGQRFDQSSFYRARSFVYTRCLHKYDAFFASSYECSPDYEQQYRKANRMDREGKFISIFCNAIEPSEYFILFITVSYAFYSNIYMYIIYCEHSDVYNKCVAQNHKCTIKNA